MVYEIIYSLIFKIPNLWWSILIFNFIDYSANIILMIIDKLH